MAIICYKCPLEDPNTTSLFQQGGLEGMCSSPTYSVDCSKDPQFGDLYNTCYMVTIRLSVSHKYIKLDCGMKALCNGLCNTLKERSNLKTLECSVQCCEENFCNQSMNSSSIYVPPNSAILVILGVMPVVLASLNVD